MPASKPQKRSGRRQPLGLVSANTSFLPSKKHSSAKAWDAVRGGDDDGSVASAASSRFSYRGIKNNLLSRKKRGLLSSIVVAGGKKIGRRAGISSSSAANEVLEGDADPCGVAFAYEDFDHFVGRCVGPSHTIDEIRSQEDEESPAKHRKSNLPATLEVVDLEGSAVRNPHVICDLPTSITSPSWSEYGSAMLETWGVLEKAASLIDSHNHDVPDEEGGKECAECAVAGLDDPPQAHVDPEQGDVPNLVQADDLVEVAHRHREVDDQSQPSSLLEELVDAERGSVRTSSNSFAPEDISCAVPSYSGIAPAHASDETQMGALSVEIKPDCESEEPRKLGPALDRRDVDIDDLESGTTGYIAMDDVHASSNLIQCFEPLTHNISLRSPATMAMAFGSLVILTHLIWVVSSKL